MYLQQFPQCKSDFEDYQPIARGKVLALCSMHATQMHLVFLNPCLVYCYPSRSIVGPYASQLKLHLSLFREVVMGRQSAQHRFAAVGPVRTRPSSVLRFRLILPFNLD
jgi:hypothetical protein